MIILAVLLAIFVGIPLLISAVGLAVWVIMEIINVIDKLIGNQG